MVKINVRKSRSAEGHMRVGPTTKTAKARIERPGTTLGGKVGGIRKALEKAYGKHTKR
jgi:hypothetical protein